MTTKFVLGKTVMTRGVADRMAQDAIFATFCYVCLKNHSQGDWGELSQDDTKANDCALVQGERLLSAYYGADGTKIWIITEWDRSATTILFPDEY